MKLLFNTVLIESHRKGVSNCEGDRLTGEGATGHDYEPQQPGRRQQLIGVDNFFVVGGLVLPRLIL